MTGWWPETCVGSRVDAAKRYPARESIEDHHSLTDDDRTP